MTLYIYPVGNFGFKPRVIQGVVWLRRNSPKIAPHYSNNVKHRIPFFFLSFLPVFLISEYSGTFSLFSSSSWNSRRLSIFFRDFLSLCLSMMMLVVVGYALPMIRVTLGAGLAGSLGSGSSGEQLNIGLAQLITGQA